MAEKVLQFRSQKIADPEDGEPPAAAHRDLLSQHHCQKVRLTEKLNKCHTSFLRKKIHRVKITPYWLVY